LDRLSAGSIEKREHVDGALFEGASEPADLHERGGNAAADRIDHFPHQLLRPFLVGFAVGGHDALVDAPGCLDFDVLFGGEHRLKARSACL